MSRNDPTGAEPEACPYVGLADDPRTRFSFPVQGHRCHVRSKPAKIDLAWQGAYCLSSNYPTCERYRPPTAGRTPVGAHGLTVAAAAVRTAEDAGTADPEPAVVPGLATVVEPERVPVADPQLVGEAMPVAEPAQVVEPEPVAEPEPELEPKPQLAADPEPVPHVDAGLDSDATFRPAIAPPTPWKDATTSSVLAGILPPRKPPAPSSETGPGDRDSETTGS